MSSGNDASGDGTPSNMENIKVEAIANAAKAYKDRCVRLETLIGQQKHTMHTLEEENNKMKRLLVGAKRSLENKKAACEALQNQINELKASEKNTNDGREPRRILQKLKQTMPMGPILIWCLVEYASENDLDEDLKPPECGWHSFRSEDELSDYIRKVNGEPLRVPELSLTPPEVQEVKQELSEELERVQEEFRRYRVRAEITRKQKEAEIRKISASNLARQQENLSGTDVQSELQAARLQVRRLAQLQTVAEEKESEWNEKYEKLQREYQKLSGTMGETILAMEWRERYEQVLKEKTELEAKLSSSDASFQLAQDLEGNDIAKLKTEFALYRKRAMQVVEQKEKELQAARSGYDYNVSKTKPNSFCSDAPRSGGGFSSNGLRRMSSSNSLNGFETSPHTPTTNEYLKNIVVKYMSTDHEEVKEHMEKAIATLLHFFSCDITMASRFTLSDIPSPTQVNHTRGSGQPDNHPTMTHERSPTHVQHLAAAGHASSMPSLLPVKDDIATIAEFLLEATNYRPSILVVCGSGLGSLSKCLENTVTIHYDDIPKFPKSTVAGHAGELVFGEIQGVQVVCMRGRFHTYEGHDIRTTTLPIRVMCMIGVKFLIVTNAAGALNDSYNVGDVMIMADHLNMPGLAGKHPLVGPNDDRFGERFTPLSDAYDVKLQNLAWRMAKQHDMTDKVRRNGVYCFVSGPTYETPTECRLLRLVGGDSVGMSTVPEVIVARHCGMKTLGLSLITNKVVMPGSQRTAIPASHQEVLDAALATQAQLEEYVRDLMIAIGTEYDDESLSGVEDEE
ncbi:purine nucleoside phosphorylase 1 [Thraustotheca clavata]|uniref:purine-nucleoside phosphorylase n=1 Tax=Thraustotheca clavata TaxID=74557 RepID=A0A1V9ZW56_9STRA|nr:purine nucleoside phosphorylase 1 [Thraustotheca clavata]